MRVLRKFPRIPSVSAVLLAEIFCLSDLFCLHEIFVMQSCMLFHGAARFGKAQSWDVQYLGASGMFPKECLGAL